MICYNIRPRGGHPPYVALGSQNYLATEIQITLRKESSPIGIGFVQ
jgi:hypothetical protein